MEIIISILRKIRARPKIYLGRTSLELLSAFISGCVCYHNECTNEYLDFFQGFQKYIQNRYKISTSQGWASIIIFFSENDEEAFYKFYELFEEYINEIKLNK